MNGQKTRLQETWTWIECIAWGLKCTESYRIVYETGIWTQAAKRLIPFLTFSKQWNPFSWMICTRNLFNFTKSLCVRVRVCVSVCEWSKVKYLNSFVKLKFSTLQCCCFCSSPLPVPLLLPSNYSCHWMHRKHATSLSSPISPYYFDVCVCTSEYICFGRIVMKTFLD